MRGFGVHCPWKNPVTFLYFLELPLIGDIMSEPIMGKYAIARMHAEAPYAPLNDRALPLKWRSVKTVEEICNSYRGVPALRRDLTDAFNTTYHVGNQTVTAKMSPAVSEGKVPSIDIQVTEWCREGQMDTSVIEQLAELYGAKFKVTNICSEPNQKK